MRLRAEKNRRNLFGLDAPAKTLTDLVPAGRIAIDAGANAGLYTYWFAQSASHVHSFEPQPQVFRRLERSVPANVTSYNVALSDHQGEEVLHIPHGSGGEASLRDLGSDSTIEDVTVTVRTLDSYNLTNVGFLKIDVEGHEESLLEGARATIGESKPLVFIELEERHNPGGLARVSAYFKELGYTDEEFMVRGERYPLTEFDFDTHQGTKAPTDPDYVNNFIFRA